MNYITEINAFYDWLETNPTSDSSIVLWHALMHINNKCGWKSQFAVAISSIQNKTGLSKSSILRARNALQQSGRLKFIARSGNQSCLYSLIAFHTDTQSGTQTVTQTDAQTVTQTVTQTDTIPKLNNTKLNNTSFKKEVKKPALKFKPPSVQEVEDFIREKQYSINALTFWNFYASKDWYVGKNKMKDWKKAIAGWESRNKQEKNGKEFSNTATATNSNQGYKPASVNTEELIRELTIDFENGNIPGKY